MKTKKIVTLIIIVFSINWNCYSQITNVSHTTGGTDWVGWATPGFTLDFGFGAGPTTFMQLIPTTGDLNLVNGTSASHQNSYQIGGYPVLWHNGDPNNIFVGVGAGTGTTGTNNTILGPAAGGGGNNAGGGNTSVGWGAGGGNVGAGNVFIGLVAGKSNYSGSNNIVVGNNPMAYTGFFNQNLGDENIFLGSMTGWKNFTGDTNIAIGYNAFLSNESGTGNIVLGERAGFSNVDGHNNVYIGTYSGYNNGNDYNTYVGYYSGSSASDLHNSFYGSFSGTLQHIGQFNSFFGDYSGEKAVDVENNSLFGAYSGLNFTSGNLNTFLGYSSGTNSTSTVTNTTTVGANAIVPADNQMILGDNSVNVGIGLSNDNTNGLTYVGPGNKLEINAGQYGANTFEGPPALGAGHSGLRFRDMTNVCKIEPNLGLGVLSVNDKGDVIYVETIGNYCGVSPQRAITGDYEVPLTSTSGSFDYYFTGQKDGSTDVLVGNPCSGNSTPYAKLQAYQPIDQTSSPIGESDAARFTNTTRNHFAIGAVGYSERSPYTNYGLKGFAGLNSGATNYGVFGTTVYNPILMGNVNVGVYGYSPGTKTSGATIRHAVVGDLGVNPCTTLPGTACPTGPDFAGYFNGDVISTTNFFVTSDANLKENVQDVTDPMSIISQLSPKTYTFKQADNMSMFLPDGTHYGLIAQDVESILPEIVKSSVHPARFDSMGTQTHAEIDFKAINYTELIPILIGAIKQQQQDMEAMQAELATLNGGGNRQGNHGSGQEDSGVDDEQKSNSINVTLENTKAIVLNQNVPNPFAEQTTISYFIPDNVSKVQIFFYDNKGTIMKIVDVAEKGAGQLNVFAADLSSGSYRYTLIADGKVVETKTMVKQ